MHTYFVPYTFKLTSNTSTKTHLRSLEFGISSKHWSQGFALTGYVVPGCVEDGTWMLWENSSIVAVVIIAILAQSFLHNFSENSLFQTLYIIYLRGYLCSIMSISKIDFPSEAITSAVQCFYVWPNIHMSSTSHHILSISHFWILY